MKENNTSITVIGAGTWGTTLTIMLAEKGYNINLWVRSESVYKDILINRTNKKYTFENKIPENVRPYLKNENEHEKKTHTEKKDYPGKRPLFKSNIILFAVPSHALRNIIRFFYNQLSQYENEIKAVVNAAKGFEVDTDLRLSEVLSEELPASLKEKIAVLSGPNIAIEILQKLPSVSVISSLNRNILNYLQLVFSNDYFRVYTNRDLRGVEVSAAVKNIIAIAAGISDGLGYGTNTKSSLITRGLYELSKIGSFIGADLKTFSGVAGMGDLITTCISNKSRNRMVGERLAGGEKIDNIIKSMHMVAEGVNTTKSVYNIAKKNKIDLPITEAVYNIIYLGADPLDSVKNLMSRKFKSEV
jgi:glycerol-3-phosphate dehydrogenase (NAD(P)+)